MNIKELLEAVEEGLKNGWITENSEVTIEMPSGRKHLKTENNQHHINAEYPWNIYYMLDHTFSLTLGEVFNELEYEELDKELDMTDIEHLEMRKMYEQGRISKEDYLEWLKEQIWKDGNEDQS